MQAIICFGIAVSALAIELIKQCCLRTEFASEIENGSGKVTSCYVVEIVVA